MHITMHPSPVATNTGRAVNCGNYLGGGVGASPCSVGGFRYGMTSSLKPLSPYRSSHRSSLLYTKPTTKRKRVDESEPDTELNCTPTGTPTDTPTTEGTALRPGPRIKTKRRKLNDCGFSRVPLNSNLKPARTTDVPQLLYFPRKLSKISDENKQDKDKEQNAENKENEEEGTVSVLAVSVVASPAASASSRASSLAGYRCHEYEYEPASEFDDNYDRQAKEIIKKNEDPDLYCKKKNQEINNNNTTFENNKGGCDSSLMAQSASGGGVGGGGEGGGGGQCLKLGPMTSALDGISSVAPSLGGFLELGSEPSKSKSSLFDFSLAGDQFAVKPALGGGGGGGGGGNTDGVFHFGQSQGQQEPPALNSGSEQQRYTPPTDNQTQNQLNTQSTSNALTLPTFSLNPSTNNSLSSFPQSFNALPSFPQTSSNTLVPSNALTFPQFNMTSSTFPQITNTSSTSSTSTFPQITNTPSTSTALSTFSQTFNTPSTSTALSTFSQTPSTFSSNSLSSLMASPTQPAFRSSFTFPQQPKENQTASNLLLPPYSPQTPASSSVLSSTGNVLNTTSTSTPQATGAGGVDPISTRKKVFVKRNRK